MRDNLIQSLVVFLLSMMTFASGTALAQGRHNMDVVLVMDNSGSMKKTDPQSLRIPAAQLFISLLDKDDRAAVVSFSEHASILQPLTMLHSKNGRESLLGAARRITSDGKYTNLLEAFSSAAEMLSSDSNPDREQIIVLMSDGMMDVGDPVRDKALTENLRDELAARMKHDTIRVYAIAFTDLSDRSLLERIAKKTGGFYNLARSDRDFHLIFTSVFESLKSPEMLPLKGNSFLVDDSVDEVTIVATKESPETGIQIVSPAGEDYAGNDLQAGIGWFVSNNFDMITIAKPAQGRWQLLFSTGENNKAYVITHLSLQTNFDERYSIFGEPLDVRIWLEKDGHPITEMNVLDKIDFSIELTAPGGNTMKLQPFYEDNGVYVRKIAPFTPGNFTMTIAARGMTFERQKRFVFNVADVAESKEDMKDQKAAQKEMPSEDRNVAAPADANAVSWGKVALQFLSINLLLGAIALIYLKRHRISDLSLLKSRNNKRPADNTALGENTPASQEEPGLHIPLDETGSPENIAVIKTTEGGEAATGLEEEPHNDKA